MSITLSLHRLSCKVYALSEFSDCKVLLCDFHREQAWERWTSKKDNGVAENCESILALMRQLARARTEDGYENALEKLKDMCEWKNNKNFKKWLENTWLRHKKVVLMKLFASECSSI